MSRICGYSDIGNRDRSSPIRIDDLIRPLSHWSSYKSEVSGGDNYALARVYYESDGPSTCLAAQGHKGSCCIFTGYLLNLREITDRIKTETRGSVLLRDPAELIAYLVLEKGPGALKTLNGIFAFALWQPMTSHLWLGVDRYGMRPLYYSREDQVVKFASEVKSLAITQSSLSLDPCSLEEMFVFGFLLGNRTMFNNISRIPPATVLKFTPSGESSERYWWFDDVRIDDRLSTADYLADNDRLFRQALDLCARDLPDVTCLVSSGYDSRRIILDLAEGGKEVHSFTVAYSKTHDKYEVESEISKKLGAELGTIHTVADHAAPDEEATNIRDMLTLLDFESDEHQFIMPLMRHIPAGGPPNFDGLGGDILINGLFLRNEVLEVTHDNRKLTDTILRFNPNLWSSYVNTDPNEPSLRERILGILNDLPDSANKPTLFFFLSRTRREIGLFPYGLLNMKVESYLPYLDNSLFDQSLSLPPGLKCRTNLQEKILRLRHGDIMDRVPNSHMTDISTNPGGEMLHYCRPLGDYWHRVLRNVYLASSREIFRSPAIFRKLTAKARLLSISFLIANVFGHAPEFMIRKSWSLRKLGQLAYLQNVADGKTSIAQSLEQARANVFADNDRER